MFAMEAPDRHSSIRMTLSTDEYDRDMCLSSVVSCSASNEQRADVLKEFTTLLGTKSTGNSSKKQDLIFNELVGLLSKSLNDDDVVLTVPSLELQLSDGESSVLPGVGEPSKVLDIHKSPELPARPNMAASVLTLASEGKSNVDRNSVKNIGKQTSWTKSTLRYASGAVGTNILESFSQLVNARVRAWTLLLLRHSLSTGDVESRTRLMNMLSAKIKSVSAETTFKTLPLPPSASGKPKDADLILPLLFEAHLSLMVQEKAETLLIRAPGTVSALFANEGESSGLKKVMVRLDSGVVLNSMVDQARLVVLKAVASATKAMELGASAGCPRPIPSQALHKSQVRDQTIPEVSPSSSGTVNLSNLRSALNLSQTQTDQSIPLQKARSSALKLNGVLHGKPTIGGNITSTGMRKVRSVKWEEPVQAPKLGPSLAPNPKKLRLVETACKLKSFKSFGRPHGGDSGSGPRNATFGAMGSSGTAGVWGRDGRLAHHPRPMNQGMAQSDQMGMTGVADQNATFNLPKLNQTNLGPFSHVLRSQLMGNTSNSTSSSGTSLPRSTTALENSLLNKWA